MSAMAAYSTEQFLIGAAYEGKSSGYGDWYEDEDDNMVYSDGPSAYRLVAKYMAPKFEVGGLYQGATLQMEDDLGTGFDDINSTVMGLGVLFKANEKWNIKGAMYATNLYTDAEDDSDTADVDESDTTATQLAFGVDRIFTENVMVYFQYVMVGNGENYYADEDGAGIALGGGQSGFGRKTYGTIDSNDELQDPSGFSVGTVITW